MSHDNIPNAPGIYAIRNTVSGRIYIGSSGLLRKRVRQHNSELVRGIHKNPKLQHSWSLHGEHCFEFFVVEYVDNKEDLIAREQYWIDCADASSDENYNILKIAGSSLGQVRSAETRAKISEVQKGKKLSEDQKKRIGDAHRGKVLSEETKKRMSESAKGKVISEETRKKISEAKKGTVMSEEARRKSAEGNRKTKRTPEYRALASAKALASGKYKGSKPSLLTPEEQRLRRNANSRKSAAKKRAAKLAAKLQESSNELQ